MANPNLPNIERIGGKRIAYGLGTVWRVYGATGRYVAIARDGRTAYAQKLADLSAFLLNPATQSIAPMKA